MNIAILYNHPSNYTGGYNYTINIIKILYVKHNIFLYCSNYEFPRLSQSLKDVDNVKISKKKILENTSLIFFISKLFEKLFNSFYFIDKFLKRDSIDIILNSYYYGKYKFIHWFPDFQFIYYPDLFDTKIHKLINKTKIIYSKAFRVILSSKSSEKDLKKIIQVENKHIIYKFPIYLTLNQKSIIDAKVLLSKHNIKEYQYIIICNQFWEHKNHRIFFEAFQKFKNKNKLTLVCTGDLRDNRTKNNYIKNFTSQNPNIVIFGMIEDYKIVQSLIYLSKAYANPSFFEGWNTGVEEAKAMKKLILASNIDVHKEQLDEYKDKIFFDPKNSKDVLNSLETLDNSFSNTRNVLNDLDRLYKLNNNNLLLKSNYLLRELDNCL